jgi:hypothetical protein
MDTQSLLTRLDEIGRSLERSKGALALIGLGSVGLELDRIDEYSDLDFFIIVEAGYKQAYIDSLRWLSDVHAIAYSFLNTVDGYKLLFSDGIFCELAIFELDELKGIPFAPGGSSGNEQTCQVPWANRFPIPRPLQNEIRTGCWVKH